MDWLPLVLAALFMVRFAWLSTGDGGANSLLALPLRKHHEAWLSSELPPVIAEKFGARPPLLKALDLVGVAWGFPNHLLE